MKPYLLKAEMAKRGVKAKDLSDWLGVPKAGVYRRLNGQTKFSIDETNTLRIKLHLTADQTVRIFLED